MTVRKKTTEQKPVETFLPSDGRPLRRPGDDSDSDADGGATVAAAKN